MQIQRKIIKQGKRNVVSRPVHAKNDKETIAIWRSDLDRILVVFKVRSVVPVRLPLDIEYPPQTELAINTHVTVTDTYKLVSDIHQNILKGQDGTGGQHQSVSDVGTLSITKQTLTIA